MAISEIRSITVDPAVIALGVPAGDETVAEAAAAPSTTSPACQAAVLGYRTAHLFRILFSSLVFVVGLASAAALVIAIVRLSDDRADVTAVVAGISGLLGSAATGFLIKQMRESIATARKALTDVETYCGIRAD